MEVLLLLNLHVKLKSSGQPLKLETLFTMMVHTLITIMLIKLVWVWYML
nr:MAG TPA: hypothetical protein [Caudoviricetes sp.]